MSAQDQLNHQLSRFEREFPAGENVRRMFRSSGSDPMYAAPAPRVVNPPVNSWVLHVRLRRHLEDTLGFTRQFVVYCQSTPDLQSRSIPQLKRIMESAKQPVATDFAMIVSSDPLGAEKIRDWAVDRSDGIVVLHVDTAELEGLLGARDPGDALPALLDRAFSERNLYDDRDPVSGDRFFGRTDELRELDRLISQGNRHIGVFGLRRIGKTSLLLELRDRLRLRPEVAPVLLDLELSSGAGSAAHVAHRLGDAVAHTLAQRSANLTHRGALRALKVPDDWESVPRGKLISDLGVSLVSVLSHGALQGIRLVLILDEAEVLMPTPDTPLADTLALLRMVRGVSQETGQLTLVLAGVNATPIESTFLGQDDNPLFHLLSVKYLGPLDPGACRDMIRVVGRKMRVRWQPAGLDTLTDYVGAHPLLARIGASEVATAYPERPSRPNAEMVREALSGFARRNSAIFAQMVQSLRRYYPDELDVLRLLATGETAFAKEIMDGEPSVLNHLTGYGVVDESSLRLAVPALQDWFRNIEGA